MARYLTMEQALAIVAHDIRTRERRYPDWTDWRRCAERNEAIEAFTRCVRQGWREFPLATGAKLKNLRSGEVAHGPQIDPTKTPFRLDGYHYDDADASHYDAVINRTH